MTEQVVPPPEAHRGSTATDDHVAGRATRGAGQPTDELDRATDDEHLSSPSQGVRPVETPDAEGAEAGT